MSLRHTATLAAALALGVPAAFADNLYVCQNCTSAPSAPAIITDGSQFTMGISGSATLENPLLVIVGVYDGSSAAPPTLSFGTTDEQLATAGIYGLQVNEATFDATSVSLALKSNGHPETPATAYNVLGLADQGASETFSNWVGVDTTGADGTSLGLTTAPGWFELFAFEVPTSLSGSSHNFDISGAANGSFIIGYSCDSTKEGDPVGSACASGGIANTPMTTAGVLNIPSVPVPEPGTFALFGAALGGLALMGRRRRKA